MLLLTLVIFTRENNLPRHFTTFITVLKQLESNIAKNKLFTKKQRLLLAISGGVDSVALAYLLKDAGYSFALAHCNFKLRGKDSEADEKFCRELAKKMGVQIYVHRPNVKEYCEKSGASVQMAARDLRYNWFKQLVKKEKLDYVLTAHHANDVTETMVINLVRGTGIKGLKGIPAKNDFIVRPLLPFSLKEIEAYVKKNKLKFRTDKSNSENKYERNFLRNKVIPLFKTINPSLEQTFLGNAKRMALESAIVDEYISKRKHKLLEKKKGTEFVSRKKLRKEKHPAMILHQWLSPLGFSETQLENIVDVINGNSSEQKKFLSETRQLVVSRDEIILTPLAAEFKPLEFTSLQDLMHSHDFSVSEINKFEIPQKNELVIEKQKLVFPLFLRSPQTADKFRPFGMKGFKLVSDFLKDEKMSILERQQAKLLVNGNSEIVWVIGHRSDDRYRIDEKKGDFIKLKVIE